LPVCHVVLPVLPSLSPFFSRGSFQYLPFLSLYSSPYK
jgi:hypothetical protein